MIRILHSVSNMDRGGIETMLMNYYRNIDRSQIQFDFLCNKQKPGDYDEEILSMGGRIFRTPGLNPLRYLKYLKYMKELFENNPEYQIVEVHNGALGNYALYAAKKNNIPNRIYHAHSCGIPRDVKWPLKIICKGFLKHNYTARFSCGEASAQFFFLKEKFELITNAIDPDKFSFNNIIRSQLRKQYFLKGKIIIGHVGRFVKEKNHEFIIRVFSQLHMDNEDTILVLAGEGVLLPNIKKMVSDLNLNDSVMFLGNVSNVNEWYQAFDVFILPSLWEGLPVVGVEAQTAGLPCVFSKVVTEEISLKENVYFLETDSEDVWVKKINEICKTIDSRRSCADVIAKKGYNIHLAAKELQKRYLEMYITEEKNIINENKYN